MATQQTAVLLWLALLLNSAVVLLGAPVDSFYPYGIGLDDSLDIADDISSEKFTLDVPIVFYGERKYDVWVSCINIYDSLKQSYCFGTTVCLL